MAITGSTRVGIARLRALPLFLLVAAPPGMAAEPLDCAKLSPPAVDSSFSFAWRKDRCEGFVQEKTAQHFSVRISYFAYGRLDGEGERRIENNTDSEIEVSGELNSNNTFYKLVARLAPKASIEWRYPAQLTQAYGFRPDRIGMLAARPGAEQGTFRPVTVSGAAGPAVLSLGIVSTDFKFNSVEVKLYDGNIKELCPPQTVDFPQAVTPLDQQTFAIKLCGKSISEVRRISAVAARKIPQRPTEYSSGDAIWIE